VNLEVRIDKWLWAVRLYKTRAQAAEACRGGHVEISGQAAKPARGVKLGDIIAAKTGIITRTVKVTALLDKRVAAKLVKDYLEDLTPASEFKKLEEQRAASISGPIKGFGRPTKKARRALDVFLRGKEDN
jgi:ribosome-associated heat shock protein Hsp15